ncbi:hypothetical protein SDC9_142415 [bioreactor metagenome]|uniref:Uncharacterized protein n=1 Tax=bioreactor metagenome TaxID=1076179 RepID=A0A645E139_9ZZZZ
MYFFALYPVLIDDDIIVTITDFGIPIEFVIIIASSRSPSVILGHLRDGRTGNRTAVAFERRPFFEAFHRLVPTVASAPTIPIRCGIAFFFESHTD